MVLFLLKNIIMYSLTLVIFFMQRLKKFIITRNTHCVCIYIIVSRPNTNNTPGVSSKHNNLDGRENDVLPSLRALGSLYSETLGIAFDPFYPAGTSALFGPAEQPCSFLAFALRRCLARDSCARP